MQQEDFTGSSATGDLNEALLQAFAAAKEGLKSSLIQWKLVELGGVAGGFVDQNAIEVKISARPAQ